MNPHRRRALRAPPSRGAAPAGVAARFLAAALLCSIASVRAADVATLPLPRMVVPRTATPPVLDGKLAPREWDGAAACTAFVQAFGGSPDQIARLQTVAYVMYDDAYLYVALRNARGPKLTLLSKKARRNDDGAIVFDTANEILFAPTEAPQAVYQTLFNSYPAVFDAKIIASLGYTSMAWDGKWDIASSEDADEWIIEARAPLRSFGAESIRDGTAWRALFTADVLGDRGFVAWAPGGAFIDVPRHGTIEFRERAPAFQFLDMESVFTGQAALKAAVAAPAGASARISVVARFGPDVASGSKDLVISRDVSLTAGQREALTLEGDLSSLELPKVKVAQAASPAAGQEVPAGYCELTARTAEGLVLYHQVFPFVIDGWRRAAPAALKTSPYEGAFGVEDRYAPLSRKLLVKIDRLYMPERARVAGGTARLKDSATGAVLAERAIAPFLNDYSEFPMEIGKATVPVETEKDWLAGGGAKTLQEREAIEAENAQLRAARQPEKKLPRGPASVVAPAAYTLEVSLTDAQGGSLAVVAAPAKLKGYQFDWENNSVGVSDKVIPPWTPMQWSKGELSMWNKRYRLNALGLAEAVVNDGHPQLAGAMRMVAVIDGKEVELRPEPARPRQQAEAFVDFSGKTAAGDLTVEVDTRAEFDGFVLNTMRLVPRKPLNLERLSLLVRMPAGEAPYFVTTAGGWNATHGETPAKWDAAGTALGSMRIKFVPYLYFTDSERGFCWFADTTKGWRVDAGKSAQEYWHEGDALVLRVNFVDQTNRVIEAPTSLTYGWMVTPLKPQFPGWRATTFSPWPPHPKAVNLFWADACDWAVVSPYFSSPFPWSYGKSRAAFDASRAGGTIACAGNCTDSIGRYEDWKGRQFPEYGAEWGIDMQPGWVAQVARGKGPNDFQLWHWDQWLAKSELTGLYFDITYLGEDWNYLGGGAYLRDDGTMEPGYNYLGERDLFKRIRYLAHQHGAGLPFIWQHTTSGHAAHAWLGDVGMEGENTMPIDRQTDAMTIFSEGRLRSVGRARDLGMASLMMSQQYHKGWFADRLDEMVFLTDQTIGWLLAHDVVSGQLPIYTDVLVGELEMWDPAIRFVPSWHSNEGLACVAKDVQVSAHVWPGRQAVVWIANTAREARRAEVTVDLARLGLDPSKPLHVFDLETGAPCAWQKGRLTAEVPARFWRAVRFMQDARLPEGRTFAAAFDGDLAADASLADRWPPEYRRLVPADLLATGKTGQALKLERPVTYWARNVLGSRGALAFDAKFDSASAGILISLPHPLVVRIQKGKAQIESREPAVDGKSGKPLVLAEGEMPAAGADAWRAMEVRWNGDAVSLLCDGKQLAAGKLSQAWAPPAARGLAIYDNYRLRVDSRPAFTLGPMAGACLDNLTVQRAEP